MPPIPAWAVRPSAAEDFSGLSRSSLRTLYLAGLIAPRSELRSSDVVIARLCRHLFWHGPAASAPGPSEERDQMRAATAKVVKQVEPMLRPRADVPKRIVVTLDDGKVYAIKKPSQWVDIAVDNAAPGPWMSFPLREWWEAAKELPTGAEKGARS